MRKFLILHYGFTPPTPEIMEEWNQWFKMIADRQVERGHLPAGFEIAAEGVHSLPFGADSITGFTIIQANDLDQARQIAAECPFILSTRVYEIAGG